MRFSMIHSSSVFTVTVVPQACHRTGSDLLASIEIRIPSPTVPRVGVSITDFQGLSQLVVLHTKRVTEGIIQAEELCCDEISDLL